MVLSYADVEITDEERFYVTQRIEVTESALDAQRGTEDVDLDLVLALAWDYTLIGDLVNARETYEEFFESNSIHYTAWGNYASILKKMGDIDAAEEAYLQTLDLRKSEANYRSYVAFLEVYFDEGERDEDILALLVEGVANEGQTPWFMDALAKYYYDHGECEKSFDHYEVLIGLVPGDAGVIDDYTAARQTCGQVDEE